MLDEIFAIFLEWENLSTTYIVACWDICSSSIKPYLVFLKGDIYLSTFGITSSKWGFFLTNSGVANGKDRLGLEFFLEWLLPDDKLEAVLVEDLFNVVSSVKPICIYIVNMMNKNYISHSITNIRWHFMNIFFWAINKWSIEVSQPQNMF